MDVDIGCHAKQLLQTMDHLYRQQLLTDLVLITTSDKKETSVHKVVMVSFCKYFREQLARDNGNESRHALEGTDAATLSVFLDFLYTGHMELTSDNTPVVLSLAKQLRADTAVEYCQAFLNKQPKLVEEVKNDVPHNSVPPKKQIRRSARIGSVISAKAEPEHQERTNKTNVCKRRTSLKRKHRNQSSTFPGKKSKQSLRKMANVELKSDTVPLGSDLMTSHDKEENLTLVKDVTFKQQIKLSNLYHCRVCKKPFLYSSQQHLHEKEHGLLSHQTKVAALFVYSIMACSSGRSEVSSVHRTAPNITRFGLESVMTLARQQSLITSLHGYSVTSPTDKVTDESTRTNETASAASNEIRNISKNGDFLSAGLVRSQCYRKKLIVYKFEVKKHYCLRCHMEFPLYIMLKMHLLQHHWPLWRCKCCKKCFWSAKSLMLHQRFQKLQEDQTTRQTIFKCKQCGRTFLHSNSFHCHLQQTGHSTTPTRLLCCENCQLSFRNLSSFAQHPCYTHAYTMLNRRHQNYLKCDALTRMVIQKVGAGRKKNDRKRYRCKMCSTTFGLWYHAQMHIHVRHQRASLPEKMWRKRMTRHGIECEVPGCRYTSKNVVRLTEHMKKKHPGTVHQCTKCTFSTPILHQLSQHLCRQHSLGKVCEICGKSFRKQLQLRIHRVSKHNLLDPKLQLISCTIQDCGYVTYHNGLMKQHMLKHTANSSYPCPYCGRKLKREKYLTKHINKVHKGIRPFICDQCGATYGEEWELKSHMARHETVARFHCEHCSYRTQDKGNLKSHLWSRHKMLLHKNQKLFCCDVCDYKCDRKTRFMDHLNTHKQVRQFACKRCGRMFFTKSTLDGHVKVVHSETEVQCTYCEYKTKNKYHMKSHIRVMHTHRHVKPYQCSYCEFCCATSGNCRKHIMNKHKNVPVKWVKVDSDGNGAVNVSTAVEAQKKPTAWQSSQTNVTTADNPEQLVKDLACDPEILINTTQHEVASIQQLPSLEQLKNSNPAPSGVDPPQSVCCSIPESVAYKHDNVVVTQSEDGVTKPLCLYLYLTD